MAADALAAVRVLYAEDNAFDADLTKTHFASAAPEFAFEVVRTGEECVRRLREDAFDVLLLDNHLPDMAGVNVLRRLNEFHSPVPVVVTTSVGDETVVVQMLQLGAVDYVPKDGEYVLRLPAVLRNAVTVRSTRPSYRSELQRRRVLYVEHDADDVDLTLTSLGETAPHLQFEAVATSGEALAQIERGGVDLVLADLRLSGVNALELLGEVKRRGLDVPFIVITGGGDERTAVEALKLGAYDYIVKRGDYLTHLPYSIDHVIDRHQLARANRALQRELLERLRLQETTIRTLAVLEALQQHAPVGIAFVDCDCRFQRVNDELASINGLPSTGHVGRTIHEVVPGLAEQLAALCGRARTGEVISKVEISGETPASAGEERQFNVSVYPVHGPGQEVIGIGLVVVEITERRRAEAALREHASVMADLARQKDEFLAMLSHEIRNPLAPIRTALDLLQRSGPVDDVAAAAHEVIERQLAHVVRLLDDLLDIARITRGRVSLAKERCDLRRIVSDAVDSARPLIARRHHQLETSVPSEPLLVEGDVTRLVQVLVNLLNNAAKYSDEGARIQVKVETEGGDAVLRVVDTGAGIPTQLLPKIFDLFIQDERTLDRSPGGLGIGLTLVKRITELHGGTVEAHSEGRGHGSTFTVRLPLQADQRPTEPPRAHARRPGPLRCLIVEDNADAARMLEVALTLEGHEVMVAHDGTAAVQIAAAFRPEAIVLDIGLPRMTGYEVAAAIRQLPGLNGVIIVGVTGYGQSADYEQSQQAGFNAHLVKPVDTETLLDALATGRRQAGYPKA
jgi:PAS domain S-box-containing protein